MHKPCKTACPACQAHAAHNLAGSNLCHATSSSRCMRTGRNPPDGPTVVELPAVTHFDICPCVLQDVKAGPGMFPAELVEPVVPEAKPALPALPVPAIPDVPVAALPSSEPSPATGGDASHLHGAHTASKSDLVSGPGLSALSTAFIGQR